MIAHHRMIIRTAPVLRPVLIAPPEHPLATLDSAPFAAVLAQPFVMLHAGSAIHTFTMNAAAALGRHLEVRIQVRSFEAVCRMVSAGVGIGIIFGKVIESVTRQPEMRDEITGIQWLGFALTEACFFYGLVAGLIAFFL